eukprot:734936-Rhodomonas_salina.1
MASNGGYYVGNEMGRSVFPGVECMEDPTLPGSSKLGSREEVHSLASPWGVFGEQACGSRHFSDHQSYEDIHDIITHHSGGQSKQSHVPTIFDSVTNNSAVWEIIGKCNTMVLSSAARAKSITGHCLQLRICCILNQDGWKGWLKKN